VHRVYFPLYVRLSRQRNEVVPPVQTPFPPLRYLCTVSSCSQFRLKNAAYSVAADSLHLIWDPGMWLFMLGLRPLVAIAKRLCCIASCGRFKYRAAQPHGFAGPHISSVRAVPQCASESLKHVHMNLAQRRAAWRAWSLASGHYCEAPLWCTSGPI